jgi:hypothetical protein
MLNDGGGIRRKKAMDNIRRGEIFYIARGGGDERE